MPPKLQLKPLTIHQVLSDLISDADVTKNTNLTIVEKTERLVSVGRNANFWLNKAKKQAMLDCWNEQEQAKQAIFLYGALNSKA